MATDGLWDNVYKEDVQHCIVEAMTKDKDGGMRLLGDVDYAS